MQFVNYEHIAFTIVTKSYLAGALVWKKTLEEKVDSLTALIYVTDLLENDREHLFSEITETALKYKIECNKHLLSLESVNIPDIDGMLKRYSTIEFCTAIKPSLFVSLSKQYPEAIIHYFDPDILVCGEMKELMEFSKNHSLTLLPHIQTPTDDFCRMSALDIMRAGLFNFGYLGWNPSFKTGVEMIMWWQKQMVENCRVALSEGIFVDQSWGSLFCCSPDSGIFHSKCYNVAYWNLHERFIGCGVDKKFTVNGVPLEFIHFSGLDLENPNQISIHQNRHFLPGQKALKKIFAEYAEHLYAAGIAHWQEKYRNPEPEVTVHQPTQVPTLNELAKSHTEWYINAVLGNPYHSLLSAGIIWHILYPLNLVLLFFFRSRKARKLPLTIGYNYRKKADGIVNNFKGSKRHSYIFLSLTYWFSVLKYWAFLESSAPVSASSHSESPSFLTENGAQTHKRKPESDIALIGYITAEMGIGESVRGIARALMYSGRKADLYDIKNHYARAEDTEYAAEDRLQIGEDASYGTSILCVNADQVVDTIESQAGIAHSVAGRRIGYWYWETELLPLKYVAAAQYFDEIWVATKFVKDSLQNAGIVQPIRVIPPSLYQLSSPLPPCPDPIGLKKSGENPILLCVFDATSILGRKNPAGAIELARKIQSSTDKTPILILKTTNLGEANRGKLMELAGDIDIRIMDQYFTKEETLSLISLADCYLSLHRSEGLGLSLIDAMRLGTPLLSTDYSGPVDFANDSNAWMVPWKYVDASWDDGPYYGSRWAEPDLDIAQAQLVSLLENQEERLQKTLKAKMDIESYFSVSRVSTLIMNALG